MTAKPDDTPQHWLMALWLAPFTIGMTMLESMGSLADAWCKTCFSPERIHGHDPHSDLEVPDVIEETGEHDLFA